MSLKTKNVFLTGGAMGLGKGYTEALLKLGARVVIADLNETVGKETEKELNEKYGPDKVFFVALDVTNDAQFKEAFSKAVAHLGFIDLFVNNAGILDERKPDLMMQVNLSAMIKGTYLAEEHMRKDRGGKGGRVIICSSIVGTMSSGKTLFYIPVYSATKQGIRAFATCLAGAPDIKEQGMEYAVLCPGAAKTAFFPKAEDAIRYREMREKIHKPSYISTADQIVTGFEKLATLEDMNGAILEAYLGTYCFIRLDRVEIGQKWPTQDGESTTKITAFGYDESEVHSQLREDK